MAILKFYRGVEASYSSSTHADGIYFCTDTHKILINGEQYGGTSEKTVKDVALQEADPVSQKEAGLLITYTDTTTSLIKLSELEGVYTSGIENAELEMPSAVGGISKGTTVGDLNGKTINQMFDDLLFPTVNPTYVAPSASISFSGYATLQKVGSAGPTADNFTTGYNPGAINVNGVKQANRGGALKEGESFIFVNNTPSLTELPATLALGNTTFKYRAAYEGGPQPKDNKGNNYGSPLAAGTVDSNTITVNGTHPWFASTATAGTLTEQALLTWNNSAGSMTTPEFTLPAHSATAKQMFKVPRKATNLKMYSSVSQSFQDVGLSAWTESSATESTNGVETTYYTYTYNGADRGSVKLKVTF